MSASALLSVLARSLLSATPDADSVQACAARTLGRNWRWLRLLAHRYVKAFAGRPRPRHRDVVKFLLGDQGFQGACTKYGGQISVAVWLAEPQRMQPIASAETWNIPRIESAGQLADWLSVSISELEWLADLKGLNCKSRSLQLSHYVYRVLTKRDGGVRLIESPKPLLKEVQRRILTDILDHIPPHAAAHGFVKGRSIVTFCAPHTAQQVLLRLDLQDFFPGCPAACVQAVFRTLGYPDSVASLLAGVCTNSVPVGIWGAPSAAIDPSRWHDARRLYASPHLPQGAPTSPAMANVISYRLDCRLSGLARAAGASYTRYADDLAFSGGEEFNRSVARFAMHVAATALEEGFKVNHRKTRVLRQHQSQHLAGLVVNQKLGVPRRDLERLEAILTNCTRSGPSSQNHENHLNFRAHLEGRVGFVEMVSRVKGQRLRALLDAIAWPS